MPIRAPDADRVKAGDSGGAVARQRVIRPWWQTWWFISLLVVVLCLVLGALTYKNLKQPHASPTPVATATK